MASAKSNIADNVVDKRDVILQEAIHVFSESGFRGILIGAAIGCFTPGGPYVTLPIAAALLRAGANIGTMVSFMTAWSLIGFTRLPLEVGIMGWRFTLIRLACTCIFPPIAGLIAQTLFRH